MLIINNFYKIIVTCILFGMHKYYSNAIVIMYDGIIYKIIHLQKVNLTNCILSMSIVIIIACLIINWKSKKIEYLINICISFYHVLLCIFLLTVHNMQKDFCLVLGKISLCRVWSIEEKLAYLNKYIEESGLIIHNRLEEEYEKLKESLESLDTLSSIDTIANIYIEKCNSFEIEVPCVPIYEGFLGYSIPDIMPMIIQYKAEHPIICGTIAVVGGCVAGVILVCGIYYGGMCAINCVDGLLGAKPGTIDADILEIIYMRNELLVDEMLRTSLNYNNMEDLTVGLEITASYLKLINNGMALHPEIAKLFYPFVEDFYKNPEIYNQLSQVAKSSLLCLERIITYQDLMSAHQDTLLYIMSANGPLF